MPGLCMRSTPRPPGTCNVPLHSEPPRHTTTGGHGGPPRHSDHSHHPWDKARTQTRDSGLVPLCICRGDGMPRPSVGALVMVVATDRMNSARDVGTGLCACGRGDGWCPM